MTQAFLYKRSNTTTGHTQVAVFREINRQLVQIGDEFGAIEDVGLAGTEKQSNQVIHWENDLYCVNGASGIFKYDVDTEQWSQWYVWNNWYVAGAKGSTMGLIPCSINGSGLLVTGYTSANNVSGRIVKIHQDGTVVESADFNLAGGFNVPGNPRFFNAVPWRNRVMFFHPGNCAIYDLETDEYFSNAFFDPGMGSATVFRDRLYAINYDAQNRWELWRLDGNTLFNVSVIYNYPIGVNNNANNHPALMVIGDELYAFINYTHASDLGWKCYRFDFDNNEPIPNLTNIVDVTSIVIPAELRGGGTRYAGDQGMHPRIDLTDPSSPIYEFDISRPDNTLNGLHLYRWNSAPSGQLQFIDTGLNSHDFGRGNTTYGTGGERIWTGSGTLNVSQPSVALSGPNVECQFEVFGPAGTSGIALQVLYDKGGEIAQNIGTLESTTVGSLSGNYVTGLQVGDTPLVTWRAALDGIEQGDNPSVAGRVFRLE